MIRSLFNQSKNKIVAFGLSAVLILSTLTIGTFSCKTSPHAQIEKGIVQVWESDSLISTGIIVNDGTEALTILKYFTALPVDLHVVVQSQKYEASVEIADFRTGATLLKIKGGPFPAAPIGDDSEIKTDQAAFIRGWSQPARTNNMTGKPVFRNTPMSIVAIPVGDPPQFRIDYPSQVPFGDRMTIQQIYAVSDVSGKILGITGNLYWGMIPPPLPYGYIAPIVSVSSALDFLSSDTAKETWAQGPTGFDFVTPNSQTAYLRALAHYQEISNEIQTILNAVGSPLDVATLQGGFRQYPFAISAGKALIANYAFPIKLRNQSGVEVGKANSILIQWGTPGIPNAVIYGADLSKPEGAVEIKQDVSVLETLLNMRP